VLSNLDLVDLIEIGANSVERAGHHPSFVSVLCYEVIGRCNSKETVKMAEIVSVMYQKNSTS